MPRLQPFLAYLVVTVAGWSASAGAAEFSRPGEFTMTIPVGWGEIPAEIMAARAKAQATSTPASARKPYDFGFQLMNSNAWFEYPYFLIQVDRSGKIREPEAGTLETSGWQGALEKPVRELPAIARDMMPGQPYYDRENHIVWTRLDLNVPGVGPVTGILCSILTETGMIRVDGYATGDSFAQFERIFRGVALSVKPAASLAYRPGVIPGRAEVSTGTKVVGTAIVLAVVGAMAGFLLLRRRKPDLHRSTR